MSCLLIKKIDDTLSEMEPFSTEEKAIVALKERYDEVVKEIEESGKSMKSYEFNYSEKEASILYKRQKKLVLWKIVER